MMKSGIYKITNEVTGKFYIGSSNDIDWRWYCHRRELDGKFHCNPRLQHSWSFYGGDKFTFTVLEEVEPIQLKLFEREQHYLDTFKPYMRGVGYNINPCASGGDNITHHPNRDAFIEKMRGICSGEGNPMFGKNHSEEAIQIQKEKAKGRFTLPWFINRHGQEKGQKKYDERRLMLANRNINYTYDNGMRGIKKGRPSDDTCRKVSESKARLKPIKHLLFKDIEDGTLTVQELSVKYGVSDSSIKYHRRKIIKKPPAGGL